MHEHRIVGLMFHICCDILPGWSAVLRFLTLWSVYTAPAEQEEANLRTRRTNNSLNPCAVLKTLYLIWWSRTKIFVLVNLSLCNIITKSCIRSFCQIVFFQLAQVLYWFWNWFLNWGLTDLSLCTSVFQRKKKHYLLIILALFTHKLRCISSE